MNEHVGKLSAVLDALTFHGSLQYSWFGRRNHPLPKAVANVVSEQQAADHFKAQLQRTLYEKFYIHGGPVSDAFEFVGNFSGSEHDLLQAFSHANSGLGYWDDGWRKSFTATSDGFTISKDDMIVKIPTTATENFRTDENENERGFLRLQKDSTILLPQFYCAFGDAFTGVLHDCIRFYVNTTPAGAVKLVHLLTEGLNGGAIPFWMKALAKHRGYFRSDPVVIYTARNRYGEVIELLLSMCSQISEELRPSAPVFTKRLAPGLSLAEDPGDGMSFGSHRCKALATALVELRSSSAGSRRRRLNLITERLFELGIDIEKPYLLPGSIDAYLTPNRVALPIKKSPLSDQGDSTSYMEVARQIGERLARLAVWHDGRCNWMGTVAEKTSATSAAGQSYRAVGPEIYGGSSGIAWHLAYLASACPSAYLRETAVGAMHGAFDRVGDIAKTDRWSLYLGSLGVALAGSEVSKLTGDISLMDRARALVNVSLTTDRAHGFDLLSGRAGSVVVLLRLARQLDDVSLVECARTIGRELISQSDQMNFGLAWRLPDQVRRQPLTGFSHGASGVAFAFIKLWEVTRDAEFKDGALKAFEYERSLFDPKEGNWPDFRRGRRRQSRHGWLPSSSTWCHGAPGMALARLAGFKAFGEAQLKIEADIALSTTQKTVEGWLEGATNFSLCHGIAGNAEILTLAGAAFGEGGGQQEMLARAVGDFGVQRFERKHYEWPCGTPGFSPSLLLGLAGIGHFYLRLANPSTPSILLP